MPLADYQQADFSDGRWTRPVFRHGKGPAVIVIHEIPGLHPQVVEFADRLVEAGMSVFMPSLFGTPGRPMSSRYTLGTVAQLICIRREFAIWNGGRTSPFVDWLRALARHAHAECGGPGVGAVGMCFTGGFALAMATDPSVVAPVLSQPSLPIRRSQAGEIDISPADVACVRERFERDDLTVMGLRFRGDRLVPAERFARYAKEMGDRFVPIELDDADAKPGTGMAPHSVLTVHLPQGGPVKEAETRVIGFFRQRLGL